MGKRCERNTIINALKWAAWKAEHNNPEDFADRLVEGLAKRGLIISTRGHTEIGPNVMYEGFENPRFESVKIDVTIPNPDEGSRVYIMDGVKPKKTLEWTGTEWVEIDNAPAP